MLKAWECTPGPAYCPAPGLPAPLPQAGRNGLLEWDGEQGLPLHHSVHPTGNGTLEGVMHDSWQCDILFTPCNFLCSEVYFT